MNSMSSIEKLHIHGVPVLPEIYGESLSYMEIQGKMQRAINTMGENQVEFNERLQEDEQIIGEYDDRLSAVENKTNELDGRMEEAEGDIDSLESVTGGLQSEITDLSGRVETNENDIDALETRMGNAEGDIDSLETRMGSAEGDIDALETRMGTAEGDIDSLETRMGTAEGDIDDAEQDINNLDTRVTALEESAGADTSYKANVIDVSSSIGASSSSTIVEFQVNNSEASEIEISGALNFTYEMLNSATIATYNVKVFDGSTQKVQFTKSIVDDGNSGLKYEYFYIDYIIENASAGNHVISVVLSTSANISIN